MVRALTSREAEEIRELRRLAYRPPTAEELAQRRAAYERIKNLHAEMPPVDMTLEELLSEDDDEYWS